MKNLAYSLKSFTKTIENEIKEQMGGFLGILPITLGASLLGNMLSSKSRGIMKAGEGSTSLKGQETIRL